MRQLKKWNRKFWLAEYYTNTSDQIVNASQLNMEGLTIRKNMEADAKRIADSITAAASAAIEAAVAPEAPADSTAPAAPAAEAPAH